MCLALLGWLAAGSLIASPVPAYDEPTQPSQEDQSSLLSHDAEPDDEHNERPNWSPRCVTEYTDSIEVWLTESAADEETRTEVAKLLDESSRDAWRQSPLDMMTRLLSLMSEELGSTLGGLAMAPADSFELPLQQWHELCGDESLPTWVRSHVRLLVGRWLVQHEFYDEALRLLDGCSIEELLDPASLLFYRGLAEHRTMRWQASRDSLDQLLLRRDELPRRYVAISELVLADVARLEPDSLDEIARLMEDISRRQRFHHAGSIVQHQHSAVLNKLDALIEEINRQLENEKQESISQAGDAAMEESEGREGGGMHGGARPETVQIDGGWGNLPPAERAAQLAEIVKEYPPHYRDVIEEYFRRLAQQEER